MFGCLNVPRSGRARSAAVVICQPVGHEYINSHRALRQLAVRLAGANFPVFRFDYFGCGDSAGDATEGRISEWISNLGDAISEIRRQSGSRHVCLIGLRLGASLAMLAASQQGGVGSLVLWDPVVKGADYLAGLDSLSRQLLRFRPKPNADRRPDWPKDIIGFPMTRELCDEIDRIDLLTIQSKPAANILIIDTQNNPHCIDLQRTLESSGASVAMQHIDAAPIWIPTEDGGLQVPMSVLRPVASWLEQAYR